MSTQTHRIQHDLQRDLDLWRDEEAGQQIETIAAACALIAYADGVVRQAEHDSMAASLSLFGLIDESRRKASKARPN